MTQRAAQRRRRTTLASPRLSGASRVLLAMVILGSVLAIGTVHVPVLLVVAGVATASAVCAISSGLIPNPLPRAGWLLLALCVFTLLQAVPIPMSLLEHVSPRGAEVWARAPLPFGEGAPSVASVSLDPGASLVEALKLWTYLMVFLSACVAGARRGAAWGALLLGGSALLLAVTSIGHAALEATRVFGVYEPRLGGTGIRIAPLIDPNNLAGYLNFGTVCVLSLAAMPRPLLPRWLLVLAVAPMVSMSLLTGSRGGLLTLIAGVVLLVVVMRRASQTALALPVRWGALAGAGALSLFLSIAFVIAATGPRLRHLLFDDNLTKLSVAVASAPMIRDYWPLGIGRGAFESVFPAYHLGVDNGVYSHPENFLVQWITEWGLPLSLLLCAGGLWLMRPSRWGIARSIPACGLFCASVTLLAQNLVDLSLEIPGVAIAVWAAVGFAFGHATSGRPTGVSRRFLLAGGVGLAALGVLTAVIVGGTNTITSDRDRVLAEMPSRGDPEKATRFKALLRQVVQRHPAEPYFYRLGAIAAWRLGQSPMPWIQLALERGISAGRTHYLLGSYLASTKRTSQALLEFRLAAQLDPQLIPRIARRAVRLTTDRQQLLRVVPENDSGGRALVALARELRTANCAEALELVRESTRRDSENAESRLTLARWLLGVTEREGDDCGAPRATLLAEAEQELSRATKLDPGSHALPVLRARALTKTGRPAAAVALLKTTCAKLEHRADCIAAWLDAAVQARDPAALRDVTVLSLADCGVLGACGKAHWNLGDAARSLGDARLALKHYEQSATVDASPKRWREVARTATQIGELGRAQRALDSASALAPGDKGIKREAEALRRRALLATPMP